MKKRLSIIGIILIISLVFTNYSELTFLRLIDNDPELIGNLSSARRFKNSTPIFKPNKKYYDPVFESSYINLGVLSIANIEYGWMGTVNFMGRTVDRSLLKDSVDNQFVFKEKQTYLIILGNNLLINESSEKNWNPSDDWSK